MQNRFVTAFSRELAVSETESYDPEIDTGAEEIPVRDLGEVLNDIKSHLTKEELLCVTLFKNSRKPQNKVYAVFIQKYYGKTLSSSAVAHRKRKLLRVLVGIGELLRYKREYNIDALMKDWLTERQHEIMLYYERRVPLAEIATKLGINKFSICQRHARAMSRLKASNEPKFGRYLRLLNNILRFSKKKNTR